MLPSNRQKPLIGTSDWFQAGAGLTRGFRWGTATGRASIEYSRAERSFGPGEYAVEYLKRLSKRWRVYAGIEGAEDEIELITEALWHLGDRVFVRLNNGFGLTSKATDWAPDVGIVFSLSRLSPLQRRGPFQISRWAPSLRSG